VVVGAERGPLRAWFAARDRAGGSKAGALPEGRRDADPSHPAGRSSRSSDRRSVAATMLRLDRWVRPQSHLLGVRVSPQGGPENVSPMVAYGRRAEMRNPTSRRPTRPEVTIALSGLVLAVLSFVPWWGSIETESVTLGDVGRLPGASGRFNAYFGYGWMLELAILLGFVMGVLALSRSFARLQPPRWLYFWIGAAMTALAIAALIQGPVDSGFDGVAGIEVSRGPLIFVAPVVCALGALAGIGYGRTRRGTRKRGSPKPG